MNKYDVVDETTAEDGTPFRVVLVLDDDSADLDPRHNDTPAGRIVALDTRDGQKWRPREDDSRESYPQAWRANAASIVDAIQDHAFAVVSRWLRVFHGAGVVLPLYEGTDGLTTGEPDDTAGPDEYRGVTFDTPTTRERGGWPEKVEYSTTREHLRTALELDVDEWAAWARGDVFGYIVQRGTVTDEEYGSIEWHDDEDSLWGLIGDDYARNEARRALDDFISAYDTDNSGTNEDHELAHAETAGAVLTTDAAR